MPEQSAQMFKCYACSFIYWGARTECPQCGHEGCSGVSPSQIVKEYWFAHYASGHCTLCGNSGVIDTRGVKTAAGAEVGRLNHCICPNGMAIRARRLAPTDLSQASRGPAGHTLTLDEWYALRALARAALSVLDDYEASEYPPSMERMDESFTALPASIREKLTEPGERPIEPRACSSCRQHHCICGTQTAEFGGRDDVNFIVNRFGLEAQMNALPVIRQPERITIIPPEAP